VKAGQKELPLLTCGNTVGRVGLEPTTEGL
jgi:hypothetical protein